MSSRRSSIPEPRSTGYDPKYPLSSSIPPASSITSHTGHLETHPTPPRSTVNHSRRPSDYGQRSGSPAIPVHSLAPHDTKGPLAHSSSRMAATTFATAPTMLRSTLADPISGTEALAAGSLTSVALSLPPILGHNSRTQNSGSYTHSSNLERLNSPPPSAWHGPPLQSTYFHGGGKRRSREGLEESHNQAETDEKSTNMSPSRPQSTSSSTHSLYTLGNSAGLANLTHASPTSPNYSEFSTSRKRSHTGSESGSVGLVRNMSNIRKARSTASLERLGREFELDRKPFARSAEDGGSVDGSFDGEYEGGTDVEWTPANERSRRGRSRRQVVSEGHIFSSRIKHSTDKPLPPLPALEFPSSGSHRLSMEPDSAYTESGFTRHKNPDDGYEPSGSRSKPSTSHTMPPTSSAQASTSTQPLLNASASTVTNALSIITSSNPPLSLADLPSFPADQKPPFTYPVLIRLAIISSPNKKLLLSQIYAAIEERFPWYRENASKAWKASIRHCLSLNKEFIRLQRGADDTSVGCGGWWSVADGMTGVKRPRKRRQAGGAKEANSQIVTSRASDSKHEPHSPNLGPSNPRPSALLPPSPRSPSYRDEGRQYSMYSPHSAPPHTPFSDVKQGGESHAVQQPNTHFQPHYVHRATSYEVLSKSSGGSQHVKLPPFSVLDQRPRAATIYQTPAVAPTVMQTQNQNEAQSMNGNRMGLGSPIPMSFPPLRPFSRTPPDDSPVSLPPLRIPHSTKQSYGPMSEEARASTRPPAIARPNPMRIANLLDDGDTEMASPKSGASPTPSVRDLGEQNANNTPQPGERST